MQKALPEEIIEQTRDLRKQGWSIPAISQELKVSQGSVSNYTKDIPRPPVVKKEAPKRASVRDKPSVYREGASGRRDYQGHQ